MVQHEQLLEEYARELAAAKRFADEWWADLRERKRQDLGSADSADRELRRRWPDGPASHPRVLAVVRKYWLACEALNEAIALGQEPHSKPVEPDYVLAPEDNEDLGQIETSEEEEVYPHLFVLEWLLTDEYDELGKFLSTLSYWPVGVDQNDRYT